MLFYDLHWRLQHATLNAFILSIRWYQVCLPVHAKAVWLCAHGKLVTMPNSKFTSGIQSAHKQLLVLCLRVPAWCVTAGSLHSAAWMGTLPVSVHDISHGTLAIPQP